MIQNTLRDIVSQFNTKGKMAFIDGATHGQIARFERENKITLPNVLLQSYLPFVLQSDDFWAVTANVTPGRGLSVP